MFICFQVKIYNRKEDINEELFKDYIEAVSNEAISWEGIIEEFIQLISNVAKLNMAVGDQDILKE